MSLLLPLYLLELGFGTFDVGVIATATLLGSGLRDADGRACAPIATTTRSVLLAATALMAATGVGLRAVRAVLAAAADRLRGDAQSFERRCQRVPAARACASVALRYDRDRTAVFARYSLVGPRWQRWDRWPRLCRRCRALARPIYEGSLQLMFVLYGVLALLAALVYRGLPAALETAARQPIAPLEKSRKRVFILAGLFSLDAFRRRVRRAIDDRPLAVPAL